MRQCMPRRPVAGKHGPCYARCARARARTEGVRPQARAAGLDAARRRCSAKVLGRERLVATDDPMMASMAARYAAALFELAKEQKQLDQVERDVRSFQGLLAGSADLARLFRSPVTSAESNPSPLDALRAPAAVPP